MGQIYAINGAPLAGPYAEGITNWWRPSAVRSSLDQVGSLDGTDNGTVAYGTDGADLGTDNGNYSYMGTFMPSSTSFSHCFWVKPNLTAMNLNTNGGWIASHRAGDCDTINVNTLYYKVTGKWLLGVGNTALAHKLISTTSGAIHDTWQHVAVTCSATVLKIYFNGVYEAQETALGTRILSNQRFHIGGDSWSPYEEPANKYHGKWDNFQLYNGKELSATEVSRIYAAGR